MYAVSSRQRLLYDVHSRLPRRIRVRSVVKVWRSRAEVHHRREAYAEVGVGVLAATLLDSELVAFGGPIWPHLSATFLPVAIDVIEQSPFVEKMHATRVTETALGADVGAIGAACLVLDQTLSVQPESLMLT